MAPEPRITIAHDNLWWYGGAERVAASFAQMYPEAQFWAILGRRDVADRMGVTDRLRLVLPERRAVLSNYRRMAPLYPALLKARPLPDTDLLLTSSFAFAHHFRTRNDAPQLCYCYSPLRFAWSMTEEYGVELGMAARLANLAASAFRAMDRHAAGRVTRYVAESRYVADQIKRFYGRQADVIYPPVDCDVFRPSGSGHDGYYLFCSRLVEAYKRPSLVVQAFNDLPEERLVIANDGPALADLKKIAGPNIEFWGRVPQSELVPLMQRCAATIFPSRDDFGLVPVEVMACGRPVLAYAGGGALETVDSGVTGEFFSEQTAASVREAVRSFDPDAYDPVAIRAHAEGWRLERFVSEIKAAVAETAASGAS